MLALENTYLNNFYDFESKIFVFIKSLISFFNTVGGLLAVFFILMPIFYIVVLPVSVLIYFFAYKKIKNNISDIKTDFKKLSDKEQKDFIEFLKNKNRILSKQNKDLLKQAKKNYIYVIPIYNRAEKIINLLFDLEDNLLSETQKNIIINVPDYSDNELKDTIVKNQKTHNLAL